MRTLDALASMSRSYPSGPRNAYAYTYDVPTDVGPVQPMQLEFWIRKGRKGGAWVPASAPAIPPASYRTWRRVKPGHAHKDKLAHSIARIRDCRDPFNTIARQCETYTQWARLKGLASVSVFPSSYGQSVAKSFGFAAHVVDPADYSSDAPTPETDLGE